jgi:hypothetical protein
LECDVTYGLRKYQEPVKQGLRYRRKEEILNESRGRTRFDLGSVPGAPLQLSPHVLSLQYRSVVVQCNDIAKKKLSMIYDYLKYSRSDET